MGKSTGFLEYERVENAGQEPLERIKTYREFHTPLSDEERRKQVRNYTIQNAILSVTGDEPRTYREGTPKYKVALYDFGYKRNIRNELVKRGCEVVVLPAATSAEELKAMHVDGIMLSNGPGDPSENQAIIDNVGEIAKLGIPIFGICLGHQLLALSQGCRTEKLKYGHRGANQPVIDLNSHRTYVTSQNHGYAVVGESLDPEVGTVSHINANDKTCEGILALAKPTIAENLITESTCPSLSAELAFTFHHCFPTCSWLQLRRTLHCGKNFWNTPKSTATLHCMTN